jgi:UDP-N-acetyl-D-glucosamine/UDP-N-acetyl-D-galactosamine dehydrogenase
VKTIAVVGLGYVGLPLAVEFGKRYRTIGYDISASTVAAIKRHRDPNGEISSRDVRAARYLAATTDAGQLRLAEFIVIAVPTPVDESHVPDFGPLQSACLTVGKYLRRGATVVFESTVYPGATEERCIPWLERSSRKKWKKDFFVGYSPERINPGDHEHTLTSITKVISADTPSTLAMVKEMYESIIQAEPKTCLAASIKVAEAAKVIENTQRDLNIALVNELSIIFDRIGIDTLDVLKVAGSKWNFVPFKPGLVGGHCIGVDPYYLTYKAEMLGYRPEVILAGRRINDGMGQFVADKTVKHMILRGIKVQGAIVIVLGVTFKEDCSDLRNSKVVDIVRTLESYGCRVHLHDPVANVRADGVLRRKMKKWQDLPRADAIVAAVPHKSLKNLQAAELLTKLDSNGVFIDVKGAFDAAADLKARGVSVWRL